MSGMKVLSDGAIAPGTRVLIVEDEIIIAMTAEDMLGDLGLVTAATASSLDAAVAAVNAGGFEVAMLDINLNGHTSMPAAAALKAAGVPFIFTTGYGSMGPSPEFDDVAVVKKPYRDIDLATALGAALAGVR